MDQVELYPRRPLAAVQEADPWDIDPGCRQCSFWKGTNSVCMSARGIRPSERSVVGLGETLLVVAGYPDSRSDRTGRPYEGAPARWFRSALSREWGGSVVLDYAIRCAPLKRTANKTHHGHCRSYLAGVYEEVRPDRVIVLGNHGAKGLLGYDRGSASHCNRRGYTWIYNDDGSKTPCFLLPDPANASQNRFYAGTFKSDLQWALTAAPPEPPLDAVANVPSNNKKDARQFVRWAKTHPWLSVDVETYGNMYTDEFRILSVGFAAPDDTVYAVFEDDMPAGGALWRAVRHVLASTKVKVDVVGQNFKYDYQAIQQHFGVNVTRIGYDTRLMFKLLNPNGDAKLAQMAEMIGMGGHKQEADAYIDPEVKRLRAVWREENPFDDIKHYNAHGFAYAALPREVNLRYVARDALSTGQLVKYFMDPIQNLYDGALDDTFWRTLSPGSTCTAHIEANGMAIDTVEMQALGVELNLRIDDIENKMAKHGAGRGQMNPASADDVKELLYDKLKLPVLATTKTGKPSTNKEVLERNQNTHPVIPLILEWRKLSKLYSTYVKGLLPYVRDDGRVHPTLLLDGTGTGRLSAKDPNTHNQPSRGGRDAKLVKDCFVAEEGYVLLQFDFSTLEVRIAAALSGDPVMIQTIKDNPDFHLATAKAIGPAVWGMTPEEVEAEFRAGDKTKRGIAKTINFGTLYGQSPFALAAQIAANTGKPFDAKDAAKAQDAILGQYRVLREWINDQKKRANKTGVAWTFWDGVPARRRPLYDIGYNSPKRSGTHERSSFNTPIQGTGSDFCLMSLIASEEYCRLNYGRDCFPIMTVHDSIIFEVRKDPLLLDDVVYQILRIMTSWFSWDVPILVDVEGGPSWGSLVKLIVSEGLLIDDGGICG